MTVLSVLAACSGSSGGGGGTNGVPSFSSPQAVVDAGLAAGERLQTLDFTAPADIRTMGTASYSGSIVLNDQGPTPDASLAGGIAIDVDFGNASNVSGTAGNFLDLDGNRVSGTLDMSNVIFDQGTDGGGFVADLDGTISGIEGSRSYRYDIQGGYIYYGDDTDAILGILGGTATSPSNGLVRQISGATILE